MSLLMVVGILFTATFVSAALAPAAFASDCPDGQVHVSVTFPGSGNCISGDAASGGVIMTYARYIIAFLGGAVGLAVILMIVFAGVQYITAGGNAGQVAAAKNRIQNALIGLLLYVLMFAILNYLIPGGIIG